MYYQDVCNVCNKLILAVGEAKSVVKAKEKFTRRCTYLINLWRDTEGSHAGVVKKEQFLVYGGKCIS